MTITLGQMVHTLSKEFLEDPDDEEKGKALLQAIQQNPPREIGEVRRRALFESTQEVDEAIAAYQEGHFCGGELDGALTKAGIPKSLIEHCIRAHREAVCLSRCLRYLREQVNEPEALSLVEDVERSRRAPVWTDEEIMMQVAREKTWDPRDFWAHPRIARLPDPDQVLRTLMEEGRIVRDDELRLVAAEDE